MPRKPRVPEVLWRLFRDRASTLADTIVSLLPHPPASAAHCTCKRRGCLCCSGDDAISFLLRRGDPSDYRKLLTQCFVVVNGNAPPLLNFYPDCRWSQRQIVGRTIEMIMFDHTKTFNVLCSGYDKCQRSSSIIELLSCSSWKLLLERVGDDVMIYILKYTSIFLPLPQKKHQQVAGPPISNLRFKSSKRKAESQYHHPSPVQIGSRGKKRRDNVKSQLETQQLRTSFSIDGSVKSVTCFSCHSRTYLRPLSGNLENLHSEISLCEAITPATETGSTNYKGDLHRDFQQIPDQITVKFRKRSRPFSWQRHRKRRQLNPQEVSVKTTLCTASCTDKDRLTGRLQCDFGTSLYHQHAKFPRQCPCCLVLQAPRRVAKGAQINRQSMLYNAEHPSLVFPRKHVLNSLKPNFDGSKFLMKSIFGLSDVSATDPSMSCFHSSGLCLIGSACQYHSLLKLLKILVHRTRSCQHLRLLDKHCVAPSSNQIANANVRSMFERNELEKTVSEKSHGFDFDHYKKTHEAFEPQFGEIKSYCLKSQVVSFIWAVCRSIVPPDLLGTPSNWRVLRKNISKFIRLRRFEKFSLKQCMHKLKTSRFPFLLNKHSSCYLNNHVLEYTTEQCAGMHVGFSNLNNDATNSVKYSLLESWIFWFFSYLVVPLVQAHFYVTESQNGKQNIYYYQKSIWEKLTNATITNLKDQSYCYLDEAAVRSIVSHRSFGFSKLRLRPKENGVRILANLKAPSRIPAQESSLENQSCGVQRKAKLHPKTVKYDHFKSVNSVLRDTHAVLKGLQFEEPEKLGSSVFDYNDVYRKLCPFLIDLKNGPTIIPGQLFIVVSDVSKAFDSVDQDKLLCVMKDVIQKDKYLIRQSNQVVCTKKSMWVHENLTLKKQNISTAFSRFISSVPYRSLHSVLVSQDWSRYVKRDELLLNLNEHVKRNVLQLDRKFYLQGIGIPQGSVVSSLLCSYYYGHLERNVIFPFLEKTNKSAPEDLSSSEDHVVPPTSYMLLRFIDDFLLISTSKKQAANFFSRLQRGFRDYNCYMNEDKFSLNFDIGQISRLPPSRVYVGEDGISFIRWSGLLIKCCTLEVQADYSRYLNNHLSSSLTVCWQGKPGRHLKAKLCDFMRPKCHPIFFDSNINSAPVVRLNIYQAFLLCAMKFHCYVSDLSYTCKLRTISYLNSIEKSFRYMNALIRKRMQSAYLDNFHPILQLEAGEVEWLGLNAYIQVLKRKQARHKELLSLLKSKLLAHRIAGNESSELKYAADSTHSSLLWKIKY